MADAKGGDIFDRVLSDMSKKLDSTKEVQIGFLPNATYPDGKLVAMIAAIQEFGAPARNIPPRPFFRHMIAKESPGWPAALGELLKQTNYDAAKTLGLAGELVKGQLQQSITDTNEPPLKPATIKAKGFSKPLVDTGHMQNSVDYVVK